MSIQMKPEEAMQKFPPMWTVYDHPKDFPHNFVARLFFGEVATDRLIIAPTIEQVREMIMAYGGSMPLMRSPGDDPCIIETWI